MYVTTADLAANNGANLVGFIQAGAGAKARTVQEKGRDTVSAFDFIPVAQHAAIVAGTTSYDCTSDLNAATAYVEAKGAALHFPRGTYLVSTWVHTGSGYAIDTSSGVTFKQVAKPSGFSDAYPIINFNRASNISMGDARFVGNIAADTGESSHGVMVFSSKGISIGKIHGTNIRGDVLYVYGRTTSQAELTLGLNVTGVSGDNIFRCLVALVGGQGHIGYVRKDGAVGYRDLDAELNTGGAYQPNNFTIDDVRGATVQVTSDDKTIQNDSMIFGSIDLDGARLQNSTPGYPIYPGLNAAALDWNRCRTGRIGHLKLRNYQSYPVALGSGWDVLEIGNCDFENVDTVETTWKTVFRQIDSVGELEPAYEGLLRIGKIKGSLAPGDRYVFRSSAGLLKYEIGQADIGGGGWATGVTGNVARLDLNMSGSSGPAFGECVGGVISNAMIVNAGSAIGFFNCRDLIFANASATFATLDYAAGSSNILTLNSSFNGSAKDGVNMLLGGAIRVNGTKVVGARGAAVAKPVSGTAIDSEARTAISALIDRLGAHGLIAT